MKLPLHIAKKLLQLFLHGESIASSTMQHTCVTKMLEDGLLQKKQVGKTKALLFIPAKKMLRLIWPIILVSITWRNISMF